MAAILDHPYCQALKQNTLDFFSHASGFIKIGQIISGFISLACIGSLAEHFFKDKDIEDKFGISAYAFLIFVCTLGFVHGILTTVVLIIFKVPTPFDVPCNNRSPTRSQKWQGDYQHLLNCWFLLVMTCLAIITLTVIGVRFTDTDHAVPMFFGLTFVIIQAVLLGMEVFWANRALCVSMSKIKEIQAFVDTNEKNAKTSKSFLGDRKGSRLSTKFRSKARSDDKISKRVDPPTAPPFSQDLGPEPDFYEPGEDGNAYEGTGFRSNVDNSDQGPILNPPVVPPTIHRKRIIPARELPYENPYVNGYVLKSLAPAEKSNPSIPTKEIETGSLSTNGYAVPEPISYFRTTWGEQYHQDREPLRKALEATMMEKGQGDWRSAENKVAESHNGRPGVDANEGDHGKNDAFGRFGGSAPELFRGYSGSISEKFRKEPPPIPPRLSSSATKGCVTVMPTVREMMPNFDAISRSMQTAIPGIYGD